MTSPSVISLRKHESHSFQNLQNAFMTTHFADPHSNTAHKAFLHRIPPEKLKARGYSFKSSLYQSRCLPVHLNAPLPRRGPNITKSNAPITKQRYRDIHAIKRTYHPKTATKTTKIEKKYLPSSRAELRRVDR